MPNTTKTPKFNIGDNVWIALRNNNGSSEKIISFEIEEITFKKKNNSIIILYEGASCAVKKIKKKKSAMVVDQDWNFYLKEIEEERLYSSEEEAAEFLSDRQEQYFSICLERAKLHLKVEKMSYDIAVRDYQNVFNDIQKYEKLLEEVKKRKKDVAEVEKV